MKTKIYFVLTTFVFAFIRAFAGGGIEDAYVIVDVDGSEQYIQAGSFDGYVFDNVNSLILKGGQNKVWKNNGTDIVANWMFYRIYKCPGTEPSFTQSGDFGWVSEYTDASGTVHQTWETKNENKDILAGLEPGIYILEVYFVAKATDDGGSTYYNLYYSNYGNNFKAKIIVYNKTVNTGNWSDASIWSNGIPNGLQPVIIESGHSVEMDIDDTVAVMKINGTLNVNSQTLVVDNACTLYNSYLENNGTFNAGAGTLVFNAYTSLSGDFTFKNIILAAGVDFGTQTVIDSNLTIKAGGYLDKNSVDYTTNSKLIYSVGSSYNRNLEWVDNSPYGTGVPNLVVVTDGTSLDLNTLNSLYAHGLHIDSGATVSMSSTTTEPLVLYGDCVVDGKFYFSTEVGGDLKLTGDFTRTQNGEIDWGGDGTSDMGRALFCIGRGNQVLTNIDTLPYFILDTSAHVILDNDMVINGNGTQFLSLYYDAVLDLNGHSLISLASGNIDVDGTNGALAKKITGKQGSRIVFKGTSNGVVNQVNNGTLLIDTNVTIAVEGGTLDFGPGITDLYGTVEIRGQASIANNNYPVYHKGAVLKYVNMEDVTTGGEWPASGDSLNITIASAHFKKVILNEDKTIKGTLTIESGKLDLASYSLTYAIGSELKYAIKPDTVYFVADTCAAEWQQISPVPYNINFASGTVKITGNRTVDNICRIDSGAVLQVASQTGQLTLNDTLLVSQGGKIVLLSDSSSAAAGSLILNGEVQNNGQMIAQRFIWAKHYTLLTVPVFNVNSSVFTNNPNGTYNPNIYTYNEAYDAVPDPDQEIYSEWDDQANGFVRAWEQVQDNTLMQPAKGYGYYNDLDRLFEFSGTFSNTDQTITLSAHYNDANNGYFDGWNLIANPFTAALDWDAAAWDKTAIYDVIYYWDPAAGNYKYYSSAGSYDDGSNVVNGGSQYIPALQGFWIKVRDGYDGTNFTIPKSALTHNSQDFWTKKGTAKASIGYVKLRTTAAGYSDETVIRFIPEAGLDFDQYDVYKRISWQDNVPQIFTCISMSEPEMAINSLPADAMDDTLILGYKINSDAKSLVQLDLETNTMSQTHVLLLDKNLDTVINLSAQQNYAFVTNSSDYVKDRFLVVFKPNQAPVLKKQLTDVYLQQGQEIFFALDKEVFDDPDIGDSLVCSIECLDAPQWLQVDKQNLSISGVAEDTGTYTVVVRARDMFGAVVTDTFELVVGNFSRQVYGTQLNIYPNPVSDYLYLSNTSKVNVSIFNSSGIPVKKCAAGPDTPVYTGNLRPGIYIMLVDDGHQIYVFKLVKK